MSRPDLELNMGDNVADVGDKWNLRRNILDKVRLAHMDQIEGDTEKPENPVFAERLATIIGRDHKSNAPNSRSKSIASAILFRGRVALKSIGTRLGIEDASQKTRRGLKILISRAPRFLTIALQQTVSVPKRLAKNLAARITTELRFHRRDLLIMPIAITSFAIPIVFIEALGVSLQPQAVSILALATALIASLLFGPRFGVPSTLAACVWNSVMIYRPEPHLPWPQILSQWAFLVTVTGSLSLSSLGLGILSSIVKDHLKLGRAAKAREIEIIEFQLTLARARHPEAVIAFLSAYCRDKLKRRSIFLAIDDIGSRSKSRSRGTQLDDISALVKDLPFARVHVDRPTYVPQAIHAFKDLGFRAYPLVTPSGVIGLLGLDVAEGGRLNLTDDRHLRLLLVTISYALERLELQMRIAHLEENTMDHIAKQDAMRSLILNLNATSEHLDIQSDALKTFVNHDPNNELFETSASIDRHIGALRNSIAILRDVMKRQD